jgi:hypothetical protein
MTLEERIDKERDTSNRLALEIEKLIGESLADFTKSLPHGLYLQELQRQKKECDEHLASLIQQVQLSNETGVAAASFHQYKRGQKAGSSCDPEVAKRRTLVRSNPKVPAKEMCEIFHREKVPLPEKWQEAGLKSWPQAYADSKYRKRVKVLISKDRHPS